MICLLLSSLKNRNREKWMEFTMGHHEAHWLMGNARLRRRREWRVEKKSIKIMAQYSPNLMKTINSKKLRKLQRESLMSSKGSPQKQVIGTVLEQDIINQGNLICDLKPRGTDAVGCHFQSTREKKNTSTSISKYSKITFLNWRIEDIWIKFLLACFGNRTFYNKYNRWKWRDTIQ